MEALLFTGFGLAIFCLGVATGAIIENKLIRVRSEIYEEHAQIAEEVKKIEPMLISLAEQLERDYNNYTPVMYELQDPDATLELPKVTEVPWQEKQKNWED
tara:strand:- start:164 stop:466 length:303 start_codon:yes stop_codon:yes gene_type:complete